MKCLAQVPYRTGACLLRSLRLSGSIGSSLEVVRVSAGEIFCSRSGVVAVGVSEIVIPAGEVLCSNLFMCMVPCRSIYITVAPQSISVHNFWFSFWAQLNSVYQIIDSFGTDVGTLPGALQLWS